MPRRCTICYHAHREAIDISLNNNVEYGQITSHFAVSPKALATHRKNHLQPIIDKANAIAEQQIINKLVKYREEINYKPLDKARWMQNNIANQVDLLPDRLIKISDKVALMRELRGWFDIENKLSGNYRTDKEVADTMTKVVEIIQEYLREHPDYDKAEVIRIFAEQANLDVKKVTVLVD